MTIPEIIDAIHKLFPLIASGIGFCFVALLHWKSKQLERAHIELARKVGEMATQAAQGDVESLEEKVAQDEKERLQKEHDLRNFRRDLELDERE